MFIGSIRSISFIAQPEIHTIAYAAKCGRLERNESLQDNGHFKAAVGDTAGQLIERLRKQVQAHISSASDRQTPLNLSDFVFTIGYEKVDSNGEFWPGFKGNISGPYSAA